MLMQDKAAHELATQLAAVLNPAAVIWETVLNKKIPPRLLLHGGVKYRILFAVSVGNGGTRKRMTWSHTWIFESTLVPRVRKVRTIPTI